MTCIYCSKENLEKANFCFNCRKQIKCLKCSEHFEIDSDICIICGSDKNIEKTNHNTIEFTESENSRSFKASFSNEVGQSIGEALGVFMVNKKIPIFNQATLSSKINDTEKNTEDIDYSEIKLNKPFIQNTDRVLEIFNESNGKITLHETRLKAQSKRDFSIRLTILYLYYKLINNYEKTFRSELTAILKDASVEDGNWRFWLANNNLLGTHDDYVELKAPGRELAKEYVKEVFDISIDEKWKLGTASKQRKTKRKDDDTV